MSQNIYILYCIPTYSAQLRNQNHHLKNLQDDHEFLKSTTIDKSRINPMNNVFVHALQCLPMSSITCRVSTILLVQDFFPKKTPSPGPLGSGSEKQIHHGKDLQTHLMQDIGRHWKILKDIGRYWKTFIHA